MSGVPDGVTRILFTVNDGNGNGPGCLYFLIGEHEDGGYVAWSIESPNNTERRTTAEAAIGALMLKRYGTKIDRPVNTLLPIEWPVKK